MGVRCTDCGHISVDPRPLCPQCHRSNIEWLQFSGSGRLATFTCISIVPVALGARGYGRNNPYCSGVVTLDEGPRISARITHVDASNPQNIHTDTPMVLDLKDLDEDRPVLAFKPA